MTRFVSARSKSWRTHFQSQTSADAAESTLVPLALNLLGWYGCNAFFNVLNKEALNRWPYPWAVAWLHLVAGVAIVLPLWASGLRAPLRHADRGPEPRQGETSYILDPRDAWGMSSAAPNATHSSQLARSSSHFVQLSHRSPDIQRPNASSGEHITIACTCEAASALGAKLA